MRGAYRCDCRQGFEYHHLDGKFWIEGSLVELEYEKKVRGIFSRYVHFGVFGNMFLVFKNKILRIYVCRASQCIERERERERGGDEERGRE